MRLVEMHAVLTKIINKAKAPVHATKGFIDHSFGNESENILTSGALNSAPKSRKFVKTVEPKEPAEAMKARFARSGSAKTKTVHNLAF